MALQVDGRRLQQDLEELATFGRREDGSVDRPAFSAEDVAARGWFASRAREAGLPVRVDSLLNVIIGDQDAAAGPWTGSHLDTVPNGGMFDGALGAVSALECVRRMHEAGVELRQPVRAVAFSDEEGSYVGFLGSQGLVHGLDHLDGLPYDQLAGHYGSDGRTLAAVVAEAGGDLEVARAPGLTLDSVTGFVELHIEQGPHLDSSGTDIGVVTRIVGVARGELRFLGRQDHAGTTPMHMRRDALRGAASFVDAARNLPSHAGCPDAVLTCGDVRVHPGARNVVPEAADVHLDFRAETMDDLLALEEATIAAAQRCAVQHQLEVSYTRESLTLPVELDPHVSAAVERSAKGLGLSTHAMPSKAGHDTQVIGRVTPAGMIFVPSKDARSHSRLEQTPWPDVVNGANVLLRTLLALAGADEDADTA